MPLRFLQYYLNLHEDLTPLCGVDLRDYVDDVMLGLGLARKSLVLMAWVRCAMGLQSSPYHACHHVSSMEEVIRGDWWDADNAFRWEES